MNTEKQERSRLLLSAQEKEMEETERGERRG